MLGDPPLLAALQARAVTLNGSEPVLVERARVVLLAAGCQLDGSDRPDLLVLVPTGTSARQRQLVRERRTVSPAGRVVVVTDLAERVHVQRLLQVGADGVVLGDRLAATLVPTLVAALSGQLCVPPEVRDSAIPSALTSREREVLALVVMGLANAGIARRLNLAETTIKAHLASTFRKLGVRSRAEAVRLVEDPAELLGGGVVSLTGVSNPPEPFDPPSLTERA